MRARVQKSGDDLNMNDNQYRNALAPRYLTPYIFATPLLNAVINEVQNNIQAPRGLIFSTALASIAVAIQGLGDVRKPSGQVVPISLMLLTIADSGERKSTVENSLMMPIREIERLQAVHYQGLLNAWEVKRGVWEAQKKAILRCVSKNAERRQATDEEELALLEHENTKPTKPKEFKLVFEDTTSEALFHGMYHNLPTAGLMSSEGGSILSAGAFRDLAKLNTIWSGDTVTVDRKTTDSFKLENVRLTVSIMIQEGGFLEYIDKHGEKVRGSGTWARFYVCHPISTQGYRTQNNGTQSWEHRDKYNDRLTELVEKNIELLLNPKKEKDIIEFSPSARDRWLYISSCIEAEIRPGGQFEGAGDHASKLADNIARMAALFHYFEGFDGDISLATLEDAIQVSMWYSNEFMRIFTTPSQLESDSYELRSWLGCVAYDGRRYIRKNHILQYGPSRVRDKKRLDLALKSICAQYGIAIVKFGKTTLIDFYPKFEPDPNAAEKSKFWRE